jgi:tetratricopeptide (TPR) repeat protein/predicted Ser/Thr protein kinase
MRLAPNDRLGQYQIESVLGAGGMGVVYRAFDSRLQRQVAIKFVQPTDQLDVSHRVLAEARAASALSHPNICTVHEVADHGDHSFIVMEYVDGRPLSDLITEGALPPDVALDIASQVAGALAHAHERNVVHGDLKAANILVSGVRVKVVDFGLAQRTSAADEKTALSITGGTLYAMAPEQLRGARPDARSDVWAFGVLLQELVSGTRPFVGSTAAELSAAILHQEPARPPASVMPAVRRIIERCLATDPARRYQNAGEILAVIDAISSSKQQQLDVSEPDEDWKVPTPPAIAAAAAARQIALIGREQELAQVRTAWDQAKAGRRQLVLIAGDAGIGKTRLVTEFARSIEPEATILLGRCDQEALVAQQPFVEALEWYARECPLRILEAQTADVDGVWEVAQLVAPLARRLALATDQVASNPEGRRYRLFEAVATLMSRIARTRPLLLVVEDLHWADRPTLLLLRHLLRSSHEAALCVVATYREADLGRTQPLTESLAELRREEGVTRIVLHGLGQPQVDQFISQWIGRQSPPSLTRVVATNTEGNPFFVSEVLQHLAETGAMARIEAQAGHASQDLGGLPEGVRETIGRRLRRLSEECHRALSLAAVVGREFTVPVLAALTETTENKLLDSLDEAIDARLVQNVPGSTERYTFTHALVRDTLYGELTPARRSRLHRQVAEALDRLASPGPRPLADLAHHYAQAATPTDAQKAIECAVGAAERATAAFALEEAARFYKIALEALDLLPQDTASQQRRRDLHFRRARAFAELGLWGPARTDLEAALPLLDQADVTERTELLLELSKCAFWMLDIPPMRRYADEALHLAESLGRDDLVADALSWLSGAMNSEGDVPAAVEMDRRAMARVGGAKTFGLARAVISLYHMGLISEAVDRAHEALDSARQSQDPTFRVYALQHLGISLSAVGRYAEASRAFSEMRDFGRRHGVLPMLARGIAMSAGIHIALGDFARGEEIALEARELARRVAFPPPFVSAGIDLLTIFARSNDPGRADAIFADVDRAVVATAGWHGWLWRLRLSEAKAELALARSEWPAAIAAATETITDSEARSRPKYVALGLIARAQARSATGEVPEAISDATRAIQVARTLGDPVVLLKALGVQIGLDGSDALAGEARECGQRILAHVDDAGLRERFVASELGQLAATRVP